MQFVANLLLVSSTYKNRLPAASYLKATATNHQVKFSVENNSANIFIGMYDKVRRVEGVT